MQATVEGAPEHVAVAVADTEEDLFVPTPLLPKNQTRERPIPVSQRATSNVETKAAARKGLLHIMMNKFSSTPLQEIEYSEIDEIKLRNQILDDTNKIDLFQYDASLTKSEREYLRHIIQSGDTNSIQSASAILRNEDVFPNQQRLVETNSSTASESSNGGSCTDLSINDDESTDDYNDEKKKEDTNCFMDVNVAKEDSRKQRLKAKKDVSIGNEGDATTISTAPPVMQQQYRNSMIQQHLFRLHETKDVQPLEIIERMSRQNSLLMMDDSTTSANNVSFRHYRSMSPPISEGVELPVQAVLSRESNCDIDKSPSFPIEKMKSNNLDSVITSATSKEVENVVNDNDVEDETALSTEMILDDALLDWNPFDDISSWLDGSQGIEVTATGSSTTGIVVPTSSDTSQTNLHSDNHPNIGGLSGSHNGNNHAPFRILGTSADDVSCHPHVLSPPLMESLLAFVPEYNNGSGGTNHISLPQPPIARTNESRTQINGNDEPLTSPPKIGNIPLDCNQFQCQRDTTNVDDGAETSAVERDLSRIVNSIPTTNPTTLSSYNFWLKYSLVRDGPGLWTFLRQVRASAICILAIETTEGHVLGAFTSQPWRLSKGWYGNKDTFLWKMRRSRLETAGKSIVQQVCQESEIQVYPYRTGHVAVQYCSKKCLMLGQGEIIPAPKKHNPEKPRPTHIGKHYGYALYLDKDLTTGTTSSSETFGNPCLLDPTQRGAKFTVANIEVWTLTPHVTVADAEQSELSNLFLDGGRDSAHRLNFMNILVGGPI
jgi:TLD